MTEHIVKLASGYFEAVASGEKTFELRFNDRNYQVGDTLVLVEITDRGRLTERILIKEIIYILEDFPGLTEQWCVLGLRAVKKYSSTDLLRLLKTVSVMINTKE